jgi:hypothetical protein
MHRTAYKAVYEPINTTSPLPVIYSKLYLYGITEALTAIPQHILRTSLTNCAVTPSLTI